MLVPFLAAGGHRVIRVGRTATPGIGASVSQDPASATIEQRALSGVEAIVHLAGESIAKGRWRRAESRVSSTRLLAETAARLEPKPRVMVCASAVGYYGDTGEHGVEESSPAGSGFLADVCRQWEAAPDAARASGIRLVHLRVGVVLKRRGGALARMLLPFKIGMVDS